MQRFGWERETKTFSYLDPQDGFREKVIQTETRRDAITGVTSHILPHRFRSVADVGKSVPEGSATDAGCPFCPGSLATATPLFTPNISPGGRFERGSAVLFPNAFPYAENNAVAIFSGQHCLGLNNPDPLLLRDGFLVCRDYFRRLQEMDPSLSFCSINWNYMPPAGGGLVHPHLQTVAGSEPTAFINKIYESAVRYGHDTGKDLWRDLVDFEREQGERFISTTGPVAWIASFSPKGMAGEISFYCCERRSIFDLSEAEFESFAHGLSRVLRYLGDSGISSFNLALYATVEKDHHFCVQGKLVPRFTLPPLGTSDVNYFEKLHQEVICIVVPEELSSTIKPYFAE